jgi:DNA replication protein DnaC
LLIYRRPRQCFIALGNSGTGKTHACLALGLAACQRGFSSPSSRRPGSFIN